VSVVIGRAVVEIEAKVRIVPAQRSAVYSVPLTDDSGDDLIADVRATGITIRGSLSQYANQAPRLPKTIEAVDAMLALLGSVRTELIEQGVTE